MKRLRQTLKAALVLPVAALFVAFGFLSVQPVHAQNNMDMASTRTVCQGPCANTPAALNDQAKIDIKEQDDEPEPPQAEPYYAQQRVLGPEKSLHSYGFSTRRLRPPDLVKLYANFRF